MDAQQAAASNQANNAASNQANNAAFDQAPASNQATTSEPTMVELLEAFDHHKRQCDEHARRVNEHAQWVKSREREAEIINRDRYRKEQQALKALKAHEAFEVYDQADAQEASAWLSRVCGNHSFDL